VNVLEQTILDEVLARGPMDFARYMELALYHPEHGYYASGHPRTGWPGHFVTSPELDPAFGELWAAGFEQIWDSCGRPPTFDVVEVGPGEGSFAAAVLRMVSGDFAAALKILLVERVDAVRARQAELLAGFQNVTWVNALDEIAPMDTACVFANEVVDNMPVALVENRGGRLVELCVGAVDSELFLVACPPGEDTLRFAATMQTPLPDGHRAEVPLAAQRFAAAAAGIFRQGAVVVIDYGDHEGALVERPAGTLLCYSEAGADDRFLEHPGTKDITAHANWTALTRAFAAAGVTVAGPRRQRDVLKSLGIGALQDQLRTEGDAALKRGSGSAAVRAMSRRGAIGALMDPAGLGGLGVLVAHKGVPSPAFMARPDGTQA
jgi:SAM-dependent MidA family methyltransferase